MCRSVSKIAPESVEGPDDEDIEHIVQKRENALKVLPLTFATDTEQLARF